MASLSRFHGFTPAVREIQASKNLIQNGGFDIKGATFEYWNVSGTPGFSYSAKRPGYKKSYAAAKLTPARVTKTDGSTVVVSQPFFCIWTILVIAFVIFAIVRAIVASELAFGDLPPSNTSFVVLLNGKPAYETTEPPTKWTEEKIKVRANKGEENELAFQFTSYDTDRFNEIVLDNVFVQKA